MLFDVVIRGDALESFGFVENNTISGLTLNTFGFLVPCADLWSPADDPITTTWLDNCNGSTASIEVCLT